jgi:hypothetical protein
MRSARCAPHLASCLVVLTIAAGVASYPAAIAVSKGGDEELGTTI